MRFSLLVAVSALVSLPLLPGTTAGDQTQNCRDAVDEAAAAVGDPYANTIRSVGGSQCANFTPLQSDAFQQNLCNFVMSSSVPNLGTPLAPYKGVVCPAVAVVNAEAQYVPDHVRDGAEICGDVNGLLWHKTGQVIDTTPWCMKAITANGGWSVYYTQTTVSCSGDGSSCTYAPTFHVDTDVHIPGQWVMRAFSHIRHIGVAGPDYYFGGSDRWLECPMNPIVGASSCNASVSNVEVIGDNWNSAQWEGAWWLILVDAFGVEHVQASGGGFGYLAQYY